MGIIVTGIVWKFGNHINTVKGFLKSLKKAINWNWILKTRSLKTSPQAGRFLRGMPDCASR